MKNVARRNVITPPPNTRTKTAWVVLIFVSLAAVTALALEASLPQEWPRLEEEPVAAQGFRYTTWAEFQWRDGTWQPTRRHQRSFDEGGRLTGVTHESLLLNEWHTERRETFRYDGAGHLIEIVSQEAVGPTLHNRRQYSYRYDNDRLVEEQFHVWSHEQRWMPARRTAYSYDQAGRRQREDMSMFQGAVAQETTRIASRYDQAGRLTEETRQRKQGKAWVDDECVTSRHDSTGHLIETLMLVAKKGRPWTEALKVIHEYDPSGRKVASVSQGRGPTGALQDTSRRQYAYDQNGNQIETLFQDVRGGARTDSRKETFGYEKSAAGPI